MRVNVITPDRGDRPLLLNHLKLQIAHQTVQPLNHIIVNYPAISNAPDITPRVYSGWVNSLLDADYCIIMENDDFYPDNYIETILKYAPGNDFIGIDHTISYHIVKKIFMKIRHGNEFRSSLFTTAFNPQILLTYPWPADDTVFLDIHLWHWVNLEKLSYHLITEKELKGLPPVGIKHGVGKCGGHLHLTRDLHYGSDENLLYLRKIISRTSSLDFYIEYAKTLNDESINSNSLP